MKATQSSTISARASGSTTSRATCSTSGTLERYIDELSVTGLTSNPTIFDHAIKNSADYDAAIRSKLKAGKSGEALFFELALEDIDAGGRPVPPDLRAHRRRRRLGVARGVAAARVRHGKTTLAAAKELHARAGRPNLFIKIPGTKEGLPAIEEAIFAGVPINVTLLFSREHYLAAAEAYLRGIERRIAAGLTPDVGSVASLFVSRWDVAVASKVPAALAQQARHRDRQAHLQGVLRSARLAALRSASINEGARPQRLLLGEHRHQGSEGVRRPVRQGAGRAVHGQHDAGGHAARPSPITARSARRCRPTAAIAKRCSRSSRRPASTSTRSPRQLQDEGAKSFVKSWNELMGVIVSPRARACSRRRNARLAQCADEGRADERSGHRRRRHPRQDPGHRPERATAKLTPGRR